ncbi:hypothetical protein RN001_002284 [Aquatica leii]|uniref:Uncharacterized protein n=1 Tax=Aquatica leii TaxID=1421715 RepID=A0AAN7PH26_9COLE|nr:hypothetical protein RN001_002284 [Aquatica leii]
MKNKSKPKKPPVVEEITSDEEDENEVLTESEEEVNMNFVEEFEEMEQDLENVTKQIECKRRHVSGHKRYCGPKKIWSTEECDEAKKVFGNFLKTAKLPSFEEIQNVRIHNDVLQEISPQAIRMWIENQLLKKRKMSSCDRPSVVKQIRWSDVEKKSLCEAFSKHIHGTSLPSQSEILFSIEKFPELKNRSVKCIKTAIVNEKNWYKTG